MTDLNARLRELAEKCLQGQHECEQVADERICVYNALRQAVREALTMEPSEEVIKAGRHALRHTASNVLTTDAYRAMNEALLKELGL